MMYVKARDILKLIPDETLEKIGKDVEVDKVNQKLTGKTIFNALLLSLAQTHRMSLRMLEKVYNSTVFQAFSGNDIKKKPRGRHSSFSDRLSKIKVDYFAQIFDHLVGEYHKNMPATLLNKIYRFDPTLISISGKLFDGLNCGGKKQDRHLKIVIGQKGLIPSSAYFCSETSEANDDIAIANAISEAIISEDDITVFDRGVQGSKTYDSLKRGRKWFVGRARANRKHKVIETLFEQVPSKTGDVISDQIIVLWNPNTEKFFTNQFRFVRVLGKGDQELLFITDILHLSALEIAEIYKRRWDIEVLFRFIKQELNFKHFLARNLNGIMVYVYMVLIMAILLIIYKTQNNLTGFKIPKLSFFQEIENEIICDLIKIAGGDPNIFLQKFGLS